MRVRNAHPLEYNGISFKSKLEKIIYQTLREAELPAKYEPKKIVIWNGFKPTVPFYDKDNRTRLLHLEGKKLLDITYTPDFMFKYNGYNIIIEAKGFVTETYSLKKKLFRSWLEDHPDSIYFEVHSKKQLIQAIEIIKNLKQRET